MSRVEDLPPDLRAVLSLLVGRQQRYGEIAAMLSIEERAVHDRAHAGLALLAPRQARELSAAQREQVGEYLLSQAPAAQQSAALAYLESSAAARSWARALAGELSPLASGELPAIPTGRSHTEEPIANGAAPAGVGVPAADPHAPAPHDAGVPAADPHAPAPHDAGVPAADPHAPAPHDAGVSAADPHAPAPHDAGVSAADPHAPAPHDAGVSAADPHAPAPHDAGVSAADNDAAPAADAKQAPSSRRGGALLLGGLAVVVVVAVALIVGLGGGSSPSSATTSSTPSEAGGSTTTATTTPSTTSSTSTSSGKSGSGKKAGEPHLTATLPLTPPNSTSKALGLVEVIAEGNEHAFILAAEHLPPTSGFHYAAWLYNTPTDAYFLGGGTTVSSKGTLKAAQSLPSNAAHFATIILTEEHEERPKQPGPIVLSGAFKLG